ncbi:hypothetical protein POM88_005091 [Heracleum sosnowskyi]|uniref:Uncharacterized protein n=1 Tax=Heracleum sosnowskyi TaxID=360622 RepID=A0AAD8JKW6_9APIA|nr:hypothetical protein POM88_005091 [Heracleum sosnowskyi]
MVFLVFHEYLCECPELSIVKAKTSDDKSSDKAKKPRRHRLFSFGNELSEFMEKRKLIDVSDIVNIGDEPIIFLFKEYIKDFSHCFLALPVVSFIKQDTMTTTVLGPILLLKEEAFPLIPYSNISNEIYEFWEPDPHHKNVMHGNMCMFRDGEKTHSCMIFSKVSEAYEMETFLRAFREITENIIDPRAIQYIKPVQFGSSEIPPSTVILITQKIPKTTLTEWLTSSPSQEDLLSLFIDIFSSLKNIHQNSMCFGNVSGGIRISGNKPVLAFPAKFKVKNLDERIWKDLGDLRKMVDGSMPLSHERTLFDDLCDKYVDKIKGDKLRDSSLFILSSPIIWKSPQRYDIVRKLGEYKNTNFATYDKLVKDYATHGPSIPGIDWYTRLSTGVVKPNSNESFLSIAYKYGGQDLIIYILQKEPKSIPDVSDILYQAFPEAPSALYRMMIDRSGPLPPVIDFFWKSPHSLDSPKVLSNFYLFNRILDYMCHPFYDDILTIESRRKEEEDGPIVH